MLTKPTKLQKYFWDTDFEALDPERHKKYVVERLLEFGDEDAVDWLFRRFSKEDIAAILSKSRTISPRSRAFWNVMLKK